MALTKRKYTDFFVLTLEGHHCSRIYFDEEFWGTVLTNLDEFWKRYMVPELLFKNVYRMNEADQGKLFIERPTEDRDNIENNGETNLGRLGKVPINQDIDITLE